MTAAFRFTPRVLRRVRHLAKIGLGGRAIARRIGCEYGTLRNTCSAQRITLRPEPAGDGAGTPGHVALLRRSGTLDLLEVPVGRLIADAYRREAARFGVAAEILMARVLEVAASDNLIDAIIDETKIAASENARQK